MTTVCSTFSLSFAEPLDPGLISFIQILTNDHDWHRFDKKGKLPDPLVDEDIAQIIHHVLTQRMARYKNGYQVKSSFDPFIARTDSSVVI